MNLFAALHFHCGFYRHIYNGSSYEPYPMVDEPYPMVDGSNPPHSSAYFLVFHLSGLRADICNNSTQGLITMWKDCMCVCVCVCVCVCMCAYACINTCMHEIMFFVFTCIQIEFLLLQNRLGTAHFIIGIPCVFIVVIISSLLYVFIIAHHCSVLMQTKVRKMSYVIYCEQYVIMYVF